MSLDSAIENLKIRQNILRQLTDGLVQAREQLDEAGDKVNEAIAKDLVEKYGDLPIWVASSQGKAESSSETFSEARKRAEFLSGPSIHLCLSHFMSIVDTSSGVDYITRSNNFPNLPEGLKGNRGATYRANTGEPIFTILFAEGHNKIYFRGYEVSTYLINEDESSNERYKACDFPWIRDAMFAKNFDDIVLQVVKELSKSQI